MTGIPCQVQNTSLASCDILSFQIGVTCRRHSGALSFPVVLRYVLSIPNDMTGDFWVAALEGLRIGPA